MTVAPRHGRRVAKPLPAAAVGCRSISRNPPFGLRRRSMPPPPKPRSGQEAGGAGFRKAIRARNGDSSAPFAPECQCFLDHLVAGFGPNGSWSDPHRSLIECHLGRPTAASIIAWLSVRVLPAPPRSPAEPRRRRGSGDHKAGRGGNRAAAAYLPGSLRSNQRRERLSVASAGWRAIPLAAVAKPLRKLHFNVKLEQALE